MSAKYFYQNGKRIVQAGVHILCESCPCDTPSDCVDCSARGRWWVVPYQVVYALTDEDLWDITVYARRDQVCVVENDAESWWADQANSGCQTATGTIPTAYSSYFDKEYSHPVFGNPNVLCSKSHYSDDYYTCDDVPNSQIYFKFGYMRCYNCDCCGLGFYSGFYVPDPPYPAP